MDDPLISIGKCAREIGINKSTLSRQIPGHPMICGWITQIQSHPSFRVIAEWENL